MGILPRTGVALLLAAVLSASAHAPARACAWPDTPETRIAASAAIVEGWVESVVPRPELVRVPSTEPDRTGGGSAFAATVPVDVAIRVVHAHKGAVPPVVVLRHRAVRGPDGQAARRSDGTLDFRTGLACAELHDDPSGGYALLVLGLHDGRYFAELFAGSTYVADDQSPELATNRAYLRRFMPDGTLGSIVQPDSPPVESARSRDATLAAVVLMLVAAAGALGLRRIGRQSGSW